MGREIRRVPKGWQHPISQTRDGYQPLYDESYLGAITEWIKNHNLWLEGKHPDQLEDPKLKYKYYAEWAGNAPDVEYYRPDWKPEEMTHYQLYETVSEGCPLSPPFSTKNKLVTWLSNFKDYWGHQWTKEQAEAMVEEEFVPSMIMTNGGLYRAEEAVEILHGDKVRANTKLPSKLAQVKDKSSKVGK